MAVLKQVAAGGGTDCHMREAVASHGLLRVDQGREQDTRLGGVELGDGNQLDRDIEPLPTGHTNGERGHIVARYDPS